MNTETQIAPINQTSLLRAKRADLSHFVENMVQDVTEGRESALDSLILAKKISEIGKQLEDRVRPLAEAYYVFGKEYTTNSCTITEKMTGVSYDYSGCGDVEYDAMVKQMAELKARMADKEKFLKTLKGKLTQIDEATGEIYTVHPPVSKGKLGLSVKIN